MRPRLVPWWRIQISMFQKLLLSVVAALIVGAGATSATFTFSGNFSGMTQQQIAMALYVRFQALSSNPNSDVGTVNCVPPSAVPEPTTMLLLGTGLAGVAGAVKKRRKMKS